MVEPKQRRELGRRDEGYDYVTMTMPEGALGQARPRTLAEVGVATGDAMRVQCAIADPARRAEIAAALRDALGAVGPVATMVVAGLNKPGMNIEIQVTAYRDEVPGPQAWE
jgi:hypothetical protein